MIPVHLSQFKAAGIYRIVFDKSQIEGVPAQTLRLCVGYSEKGPFNVPMFIKSASEFIHYYGNISRKLEKRGIFFHRLCIQALSVGPILVLNLKKFNSKVDNPTTFEFTQGLSFKVDGVDYNASDVKDIEVEQLYDTSRFWTLDAAQLNTALDTSLLPITTPILQNFMNIAATDSLANSNSIFVRKSNVKGYDISVKEFFAGREQDRPEFLTPLYDFVLMSDFMAEVYVFRGQFDISVMADSTLARYFEVRPLEIPKYINKVFTLVNDLAVNETITDTYTDSVSGLVYNGTYINTTGSLIPTGRDIMMEYKSTTTIDSVVLKPYFVTAFGDAKDTLDELSIVKEANFLAKYVGCVIPGLKNSQGTYISLDVVFNQDNLGHSMMMAFNEQLMESDLPFKIDLLKWTSLSTADYTKLVDFVEFVPAVGATVNTYTNIIETVSCLSMLHLRPSIIKGLYNTKLNSYDFSDAIMSIDPTDNTKVIYDKYAGEASAYAIKLETGALSVDGFTLSDVPTVVADKTTAISKYASSLGLSLGDRFYTTETVGTETIVSVAQVLDITSVQTIVDNGSDAPYYDYVATITFDKPLVSITSTLGSEFVVQLKKSFANQIGMMMPSYLKGYVFGSSKPDSTKQLDKLKWQKYILSALTQYKGLRTALTSKNDIDYRYVVDTFDTYVDEEIKSVLSELCMAKENAFAILNLPAISTLATCDYTKFTDETGKFNAKYIPFGGNKLKNPSVYLSLPSVANGDSFCAFYQQSKFQDGPLTMSVPSAALVSNKYMEKYTSSQPYYIVAGPKRAMINFSGFVGPDYNMSREDLENVEPIGWNCLLFAPKVGTYINANQTAQQKIKSALSQAHVRELVIYLQDAIASVLQKYHWDFNTQTVRDQIKSRADSICEQVKLNGGLYDYVNIMDSSNNSVEIIDNNMAVLSTHIEPARGMGIMVHELTIYSTGQMRVNVTNK